MNQKNKAQKLLEDLHEATAIELLERVRSGSAKPADLGVAVKFLKDNGVEAIPVDGSTLNKLMEELPFNNDEDELEEIKTQQTH